METRIQCPASQTDPKSWNQHIDETRVAMVYTGCPKKHGNSVTNSISSLF